MWHSSQQLADAAGARVNARQARNNIDSRSSLSAAAYCSRALYSVVQRARERSLAQAYHVGPSVPCK